MVVGRRHVIWSSLLELFYPEHCAGCGAVRGTTSWHPDGARLHGLRPWDRPHLCADCFAPFLEKAPARLVLDLGTEIKVPVLGAQWTNSQLVELVGLWKYSGVRGLVWPLSQMLIQAWNLKEARNSHTVWVPTPLHRRRRRERGFNQARMLADHLAAAGGGQVVDGWITRRRSTGQQAKLKSTRNRVANMQGAFGWGRSEPTIHPGDSPRIIVVDDLVTSGATVGSLVQFLRSGGYQVEAVVCLAVAKSVQDEGG